MEREQQAHKVTAIHVDLIEQSITLDLDGDASSLRIVTGGDFEIAGAAVEALPAGATSAVDVAATPENEMAVVVTGHFRALPREGRPDRYGKPTAWAPFVGKTEDEEQPRAYSATFYRDAAPIVLSLGKGAVLTVRGFVRPSADPEKDDWLSVVGVLNYPGKPANAANKQEGGESAG